MKGEGQQFGLPIRQAENRRHTLVEQVVPASQPSEPAEVHQECDVFLAGTETGKKNRQGAAVFAWALRQDRKGVDHRRPPFCLRTACATENKKADVAKHLEMFSHVGLLSNEPPGGAGLFFT